MTDRKIRRGFSVIDLQVNGVFLLCVRKSISCHECGIVDVFRKYTHAVVALGVVSTESFKTQVENRLILRIKTMHKHTGRRRVGCNGRPCRVIYVSSLSS